MYQLILPIRTEFIMYEWGFYLTNVVEIKVNIHETPGSSKVSFLLTKLRTINIIFQLNDANIVF